VLVSSAGPPPAPTRPADAATRGRRRPRPVLWLRSHPRAADAMLAGFVTVLALGAHALITDTVDTEITEPTRWSPVLVLASTVPLAWRRRWPVAVLVAVSVPECILQASEMIGAGFLNILMAAYSLGAYVAGRRLVVSGTLTFACLVGFVGVGVVVDGVEVEALISTTVLYIGAMLLGDNMRRRRERADELVERAERAERERELLAVQQVQQERTRIAREMHDVVAHSLSVMIIQAGAARRQVRAHPDQAIGALENIESTGREAMSEMRRILGVLRSDRGDRGDGDSGADLAPQPSLSALGELVAAASDLPIELHTDGDLDGVPAAVELSAYRVVQEALTNVRRHAGRVDRVAVAVQRADGRLTVTVEDDGRGASTLTHDPGFGIIGMRERVGMFGGTFEAGPRSGGGWRVRAVFPEAA
jgi:signal transduction histidine kinase